MAERKDRTLRWLEVGANIGIVIGLVLVALQIAQDRNIASESSELDLSESVNEQQRHISGEELSTSMAKAISGTAELTLNDYVTLDAFYLGEMTRLIRQESTLGTVSQAAVGRWVNYLLGNPFGYAWWNSRPEVLALAPKSRDAIDSLMTKFGPDHANLVRKRFEAIEQIIKSLNRQD